MRLVQKNSKIKFFVFALALIILLVEYSPLLAAGQYTALSPIPMNPNPDLVGPPNSDISSYLKSLYNFGIGLAAGLAVLMVIWGGVEYMTTDAIGHQEEGKNKIQNAIMGLLLALSSYIILQTINKDLLKLDFDPRLDPVDATSKAQEVPPYVLNGGEETYGYASSVGNDPNGNIKLTAYGYANDSTPDTNTSQRRGNNGNLLVPGSVALSPDLITSLSPKSGAAVYVGGNKIGYYDDSTAYSYKGRVITNTIDIYDPQGSLGGNNFQKNISGAVTIDNNDIRPQTPNP